MTLYRARTAIAAGSRTIARGALVREGELSGKSREALIRRGVLVAIQTPPLGVLPGWGHRAERLAPLGIKDAGEALAAFAERADEVAAHLGVSPGLVERWACELAYWLTPPAEREG